MVYADYEYYTEVYNGSAVGADSFPSLSLQASLYIDAMTMNRAKDANGDTLELVKNAMCALTELFQNQSNMEQSAFSTEQTLTSQSVGNWSKSYNTKTATLNDFNLLEMRKKDVLFLYLGNTGLLQAKAWYFKGGCSG